MTSTESKVVPMFAHLREEAVQCGLIGHSRVQGGRAVVFADECHPVEPG